MSSHFNETRCLVTGGTGFIGGRLVETLVRDGAQVTVLARDLSKASRVGRFPVRLVRADLADPSGLDELVSGHDLVFHCAYGNSGDLDAMRRVTVDGTRAVAEASRAAGARLVHVSTVAVYGPTPDGDLDETVPHRPEGDFYAETKDEAERIVLDLAAAGDLAASVVQPTVVYGPFAPAWTVRILNELKTGREILVDGGHGLCNVVYVDDLVHGLRLAATQEAARGEAFLISGPEPVTWREFYGGYERMLGLENHVELSAEEAHALFDRLYGKKGFVKEGLALVRESPELRRRLKATGEAQLFLKAAKSVMPKGLRRKLKQKVTGRKLDGPPPEPKAAEPPIHPLPPAGIDLARAKTRVRTDKAQRLLGYRASYDWDAGLERVAAWARWAGILPVQETAGVG